MASLVDLITQLRADAVRVAGEKKPRPRRYKGERREQPYMPYEYTLSSSSHHMPLLYEERNLY
jgi:hypothetical protein